MRRNTLTVASFLAVSGACALVYQTVWLRQFRLVFGASTSATAAVLAIFMGCLGLGSALLGRRADRHPRPLLLYARLELLITLAAVLSQPLLYAIGWVYVVLGGSTLLGTFGATVVRLLLATLVLGAPTFLMGGTLPAAARAVESAGDAGRRGLAVLYASNTLGAVVGTLISTFFLLESLGNRRTLFLAVIFNGLIAFAASRARLDPEAECEPDSLAASPSKTPSEAVVGAPVSFVLFASAATGFSFLLMELVWYRMLGPILGGTTFMFGLILAVALLGIGLGGAAYAVRSAASQPTVGAFALTCTAEAALMILPFALGDRLAIVANLVRPLGALGFSGHVLSWTVVTLFVVFPPAFVSGIQFPLMIGLLGRGREEIGRHVGLAYAFNTMGAIAGSLAGGFGLIPLLSATGCWIVVALLLVGVGTYGITIAARQRQLISSIAAGVFAMLAVSGTMALGPTASWRHSGIGAGRAPAFTTRNEIREWLNATRRKVEWSADGRESSIAVTAENDLGFVVNGKSDGSARGDAGTQVMGGMVAATIHPHPRRALVIGLGTGSTAGWLATLPDIERVDVVELEPLVLRVARDFAAVNHNVLANPKVHVQIADAREVLLTSRDTYDIVFSEPSNPYRAGIASLFTREFYAAVTRRLAPGGVFVQWVQAYEIDEATIAAIYATLGSVFQGVETWRAAPGDLLLVASRSPITYDADLIRHRTLGHAYGAPLHVAWRTEGAEGFFSHYVGSELLGRLVARKARWINTDDNPRIEFGFARAVGQKTQFDTDTLLALAQKRGLWQPVRVHGALDWRLVLLHRASDPTVRTEAPFDLPAYRIHHQFATAYSAGALVGARGVWDTHHFAPINSAELSALGDIYAEAGSPLAETFAGQLMRARPAEANAILARLRLKQGKFDEAATLTVLAFGSARTDAWSSAPVMGRLLDASLTLAKQSRARAALMFGALDKPFAAGQWNDARSYYRILVGNGIQPCGPAMLTALDDAEPWTFWRPDILEARKNCYARAGLTAMAGDAASDLLEFQALNPPPLGQ